MADYGEFEEVIEDGQQGVVSQEEVVSRVRTPRKGEVIGVIIQRYGGSRMEVHTTDGKRRNCRVPGKFKRTLWLRPRDVVLIKPWLDDDSKGDVIFKYNSSAVSQLRRKGVLSVIKEEF